MEDLRSNTKKKEDKSEESIKSITSKNNKGYLERFYRFVLSKYKLILCILLILTVLKYPYEIGEFIGNWVSNFKNGLDIK